MENGQVTRPANNLVISIIATALSVSACCIPIGLPALLKALKVNKLYDAGQYADAEEAAAGAKKWSIVTFIIIGVCWVLYLIFCFVFGVLSELG